MKRACVVVKGIGCSNGQDGCGVHLFLGHKSAMNSRNELEVVGCKEFRSHAAVTVEVAPNSLARLFVEVHNK